MKKLVLVLLCTIILTACTPINQENACTTDADCVRSGCSGTVCQEKTAEPVFTTCEYKAEYACYQNIPCGCVEGQCAFEKNPAFEQCLEDNKGKGAVDEDGIPIV